MQTIVKSINGVDIVVIQSDELLFWDTASALDFMMSVQYSTGCSRVVLPMSCIAEDFFRLRTRLAGEILQKFIIYQVKLAIVGDFSGFESKSLRDFIYESNRGKDIFFLANEAQALEKLAGV